MVKHRTRQSEPKHDCEVDVVSVESVFRRKSRAWTLSHSNQNDHGGVLRQGAIVMGCILLVLAILGPSNRQIMVDKQTKVVIKPEVRIARTLHGQQEGESTNNIYWQCVCDDTFSKTSTVDRVTDLTYTKPADESLMSPTFLKNLSNRLGINFQLADPNGYREWIRPGPPQVWDGPLPYKQQGIDPVCGQDTIFYSDSAWFRDNFKSQQQQCNTMPRERALAFCLANLLPSFRQASKVHESSPNKFGISKQVREMFGTEKYTGSQFSPSVPCGEPLPGMNGDVAIDLENQTCIPDETFDIVLSQDVFEHIYEPAAAFREIARTLKPGGFHIFTVPLTAKQFGTFQAAQRVDSAQAGGAGMTVKLHAPPEIHGNPMGAGGSLLTHQWGYDIKDFIRQSSGMETTIVYVESQEFGIHHAEYREVLISRKSGENKAFPNIWQTLDSIQCGHGMITCTTSQNKV